MTNRITLPFKPRLKIYEALTKVCHNIDGDAVYDAGHDDSTVAAAMSEALGETISVNNVAGLRKEMIGNLRVGRPVIDADLRARVEALEATVERLSDLIEGSE